MLESWIIISIFLHDFLMKCILHNSLFMPYFDSANIFIWRRTFLFNLAQREKPDYYLYEFLTITYPVVFCVVPVPSISIKIIQHGCQTSWSDNKRTIKLGIRTECPGQNTKGIDGVSQNFSKKSMFNLLDVK